MILHIDTTAIRPLYLQIMDEVRRLIAIGELVQEEAMPSVRQLAEDLRINHNTIAQAYRELERDGVVYVRPDAANLRASTCSCVTSLMQQGADLRF